MPTYKIEIINSTDVDASIPTTEQTANSGSEWNPHIPADIPPGGSQEGQVYARSQAIKAYFKIVLPNVEFHCRMKYEGQGFTPDFSFEVDGPNFGNYDLTYVDKSDINEDEAFVVVTIGYKTK